MMATTQSPDAATAGTGAPNPPRVLTQRNANDRQGVNGAEGTLNPSNVNVNDFGKLGEYVVGGDVYAQPLYVPNVLGVDGVTRNLLIVAGMDNVVYAFDADHPGVSVWKTNLGPPVMAEQFYGGGYVDITALPKAVPPPKGRWYPCTIGILSTPVIDATIDDDGQKPTTGTIYAVTFTVDQAAFEKSYLPGEFKHFLNALDLRTGKPQPPVQIAGSVSGRGYYANPNWENIGKYNATDDAFYVHVPVKPDGYSDGVNDSFWVWVKDAGDVSKPGQSRVQFNSMMQLQRPGLVLHQGLVIIAFGARADEDPYHGWIFAYNAKTLQLAGLHCTTPNGLRGGIWQAGQGLVVDSRGRFYAGSGNGDNASPSATPVPVPNLGESFIQYRVDDVGIRPTAWFSAFNDITRQTTLNPPGDGTLWAADDDLGASAPVLLPDDRSVGGGKDGWFYLMDPDLMDNRGSATAVAQIFIASYNFARGTRPLFKTDGTDNGSHHIHGSPVVWSKAPDGVLVFVWGENDLVRAYQYSPEINGHHDTGRFLGKTKAFSFEQAPDQGEEFALGSIYASNEVALRNGMPGGTLSLSWDGSHPETAILWASYPPFGTTSGDTAIGGLAAYAASTFDDRLGFRRITTLWTSLQSPGDEPGFISKFCCPTIAGGRVYYPTASGRVVVYGPKSGGGGYKLGFRNGSGLALNGSALVSPAGTIALTQGPRYTPPPSPPAPPPPPPGTVPTNHAGSFFTTETVDIRQFVTEFKFLLTQAAATGFAFVVQAEGPRALGGPDLGLGCMKSKAQATNPRYQSEIIHSVVVGFFLSGDIPAADSPCSLQVFVNGQTLPGSGPINLRSTTPAKDINLQSGKPIVAGVRYDGAALHVQLRYADGSGETDEFHFAVGDLSSLIGSVMGKAYVGFSGSSGAFSARQEIQSWDFQSGAST